MLRMGNMRKLSLYGLVRCIGFIELFDMLGPIMFIGF